MTIDTSPRLPDLKWLRENASDLDEVETRNAIVLLIDALEEAQAQRDAVPNLWRNDLRAQLEAAKAANFGLKARNEVIVNQRDDAFVMLDAVRAQLETARAEIDALQTALAKARVELHWKQSPAITPEATKESPRK